VLALALVVSIAGLVVGPLITPRVLRARRGLHVLDAITLALVPGVVLTRLLPHLMEEGSLAPALGLLGGYVGFQLLEVRVHRGASRLGLALVLPALVVHAAFDGATLGLVLAASPIYGGGAVLIGAILLHRIPEGLFVGTAMADARRTAVWLAVALLASITVLGALIGGELIGSLPHDVTDAGIAVGLGIMVRMVVDRHGDLVADARARWMSGVAFVVCVILLVVIPNAHDVLGTATPHELSIREALVPLLLETGPYLFVLLAASAIVAAWFRIGAPSRDRDTWASSTLVSFTLLGPCLGLLRASVTPTVRLVLGPGAERAWWLPRTADVLPAFTVGVIVAAVVEATLPAHAMDGVHELVLLAGAAVIALHVPMGAGAPVLAAVFAHKGAPLAAVIAFVLAASLRAHASSLSARVLSAIGAAVVAMPLARLADRCGIPELHRIGAHEHAVLEWSLATALVSWAVIDLARAGPRDWLRSK
jgi:zinc transporter ZupT